MAGGFTRQAISSYNSAMVAHLVRGSPSGVTAIRKEFGPVDHPIRPRGEEEA